jgi:hypothetical protein
MIKTDAKASFALRYQFLRFTAAHGGEVMYIQIALAAVADPGIASHLVPVSRAGGSDA